jgi:hypothetical protein
MKWIKDNFLFIIIIILTIIILIQRCGSNTITPNPPQSIITKIDTIRDTIIKETTVYVPKWNTKIEHDVIFDTITKLDTTYILGDYFSTYIYNDSLKNDTIKININDSITQNKIKSRQIKYKLLYTSTSSTTTIVKNKNEFYIGIGLTGSNKGINFFGPNLLLRTKNKQIYNLGLGVDGSLQPNLHISTYWKIGKK